MYLKTNSLLIKWLSRHVRTKVYFLTFISLFISPIFSFSAETLIEKTIAIVNNEPIFLSDLKAFERRIKSSAMIDDLLLFETSLDSLKKNSSAQLQFLINEKILDSEVKRHNLTITMERVDQEIREIAKRNGFTKEDLFKNIQMQGIDNADFQNFKKLQIERQSLIEQEISSKIRLGEDDILAFYANASGKKVAKIVEYSLSHIFFSPQTGGPKEAMERAKSVLAQIRDGKSYESLISKYTEEESPTNNGFLGTFKTGEFSNEMEVAVKDLEVGGVSDVVRSRSGFHILKVINKKFVTDPDYEKNKERYRVQLMDKVFKRQFKAWLDLKKEESTIKIN